MDSAENKSVRVRELEFVPFLSEAELRARVTELGQALHERLAADGDPVFVVMLNGAFIFAADLVRASGLGGEVTFVRTRSYAGTATTGTVELLLAPEPALIRGKDVVLIEDIVDSGYTMQAFLPQLRALEPRSVTLVTLLHKPTATKVAVDIDLVGFAIPDKFVVGYGLDYNGHGRQLGGIYRLGEGY